MGIRCARAVSGRRSRVGPVVRVPRARRVGVAAAVVAAVTAALLSLLTPVGVARQAELHPGIAVNVAYLGPGLLAAFLFVVLMSVIPALWVSSPARRTQRATTHVTAGARIGGALAGAGVSTSAETGVRMALEPGRGRTSVPVRSTIISAIIAPFPRASWETQTLEPSVIGSRLSSQAPSPTHTSSPMVSFHGQCTRTPARIRTPRPTVAPKNLRSAR